VTDRTPSAPCATSAATAPNFDFDRLQDSLFVIKNGGEHEHDGAPLEGRGKFGGEVRCTTTLSPPPSGRMKPKSPLKRKNVPV